MYIINCASFRTHAVWYRGGEGNAAYVGRGDLVVRNTADAFVGGPPGFFPPGQVCHATSRPHPIHLWFEFGADIGR
jgi:hypothetical protein